MAPTLRKTLTRRGNDDRVIASCVWLIAATSVSAYVTATWNSGDARDSPQAKQSGAIRRNKTAPINVPMISNGNVQGYIVAQFVYLTDESSLHELSVPPDDFIADEAFRELYTSNVDFKHLEKYDVERLTKLLAQKTNLRLEKDIIKDILVAEFTFVHAREVSKQLARQNAAVLRSNDFVREHLGPAQSSDLRLGV